MSMKRKQFLIIIFSILCVVMTCGAQQVPPVDDLADVPDSAERFMLQQLAEFPQEKIYIQTDKGAYLSGERIWVRTHLQDALTHRPILLSRYVYVELLSPTDNLVKRIKVRPDSTGAYSGHIDLHDDLAEGSYTLRAYTQYMRNVEKEAFAKKVVDILDPFSLEIEPLVSFDVRKNSVNASIQFVDRQTGDVVVPELVACNLAHRESKVIKPKGDTFEWSVRLDAAAQNRTMLLSLRYKDRKYKKYYGVPLGDDGFVVSFFPEGGYLVGGTVNKVGYKALNSAGWGVDVSGVVYNSKDVDVLKFESLKHGMGFFNFIADGQESYYAVVADGSGNSKRVELPSVSADVAAVSVNVVGKRMLVSVKGAQNMSNDEFSLLIHQKGQMIYHQPVDKGVEAYTFPTGSLPVGIINVLLLNGDNDVLSERLVFNFDEERLPIVEVSTTRDDYKRREHVYVALELNNIEGVKSGSVAVSVVDKNAVVVDSVQDIVSYMLLSSELRGNIESPKSYFDDYRNGRFALDALMLTQGWRRYDIAGVLKGKIAVPDKFEPEKAHKIRGRADGIFTSLKEGDISLMARKDSMMSTVSTVADAKGRFEFDVEYPEGTSVLVQSLSKKGGKRNVISLEKDVYPETLGAAIAYRPLQSYSHEVNVDPYLQRANEDYTQQYGIRTILLDEVTVTANKVEKYKESTFYTPLSATGLRTADQIEKMKVSSLRNLLYTMPGVMVRTDKVTTTRSERPMLFVVDDMRFEDFFDRLDDIDVTSIESIFVIRDNTTMPGFFSDTEGAVVITTKIGYTPKPRKSINLDHIIPLGYQEVAEFYSPMYDTAELKESDVPDLRTTVYWKPNVVFDERGRAFVDFYSADLPTAYLLVGEGLSDGGEIIRFEHEFSIYSW